MKYVHNITIKVFVKEDDDKKAVAERLVEFLPEYFLEEKIVIEEEHIRIDSGEDFDIYSVQLKKDKHTKHTLDILKDALGVEQCNQISKDERRVDEDGFLFIRIDKQEWITQGKAILVDHGECIHFKCMIACFPKKKENALAVVKQIFES